MPAVHPLLDPIVRSAIERETSAHLGRPWRQVGFVDLDDRASHPCGVLVGTGFRVFAKLSNAVDARVQFAAELDGASLLRANMPAATITPVGAGLLDFDGGAVLLIEALDEAAKPRQSEDWRAIGRTLARVHRVRGDRFGRDGNGYFGPLPQDNRPVDSNQWHDFYAARRILPNLRFAVDSGHLPKRLADETEHLVANLASRCGPEVEPALLHGDAQQNNFVNTSTGAVFVDAAPYYGHPELDLALVDIFEPAADAVFDGYRETGTIDADFGQRRELWRIYAYLAITAVDGTSAFGQRFIPRLADALSQYR